MVKYNYVFFYSEGPPNDKGLTLGECKDILINAAKDHVDNISYYTPKILTDMGYGEYVKNYEDMGSNKNPRMNNIGFEAWKPLILLLELEKVNDGDIVFYRDSNVVTKEHEWPKKFINIKKNISECLEKCDFDFFFPQQCHSGYYTKYYVKTNIIKELGEDHPFSYNFPLLWSGALSIFRKSNISIEFLKEWCAACLKEEWRNGILYGKQHPEYRRSTNAQGIMNILVSNWVRKRKYNIKLNYPGYWFPCADYSLKKQYHPEHLKYINSLVESNGKIKGIYINLARDKEKNKSMIEKLDKLDFCNYRRFNAIIGGDVYKKLLEEDKIYKLNDERGIYLNNFMVGVWQSHLHIWQEMVDKNIPLQLIMEDDCNFHENFNEKFYKVLDMIKDKEFDIFYIGYGGDSPDFNKDIYITDNGSPRLAHSYILTLSGAKKLVERMNRLNWPIDEIMTGMFRTKQLKGYKSSQLLVWQPWQWDRSAAHKKQYFNQ
jgi:GR25 family glycosyltransferase involved in LPS biosynthesis